MTQEEKRAGIVKIFGSLLSIFLSVFMFFSAFFLIYANELATDRNAGITQLEERTFYSNIFLGEYLQKVSDYKKTILIDSDNGEALTLWIIRLFGALWLGFGLTLFFIPVFTSESKDKLSIRAFIISIILTFIFIIALKIYLFYLSGGFAFDFSWLTDKPDGGGLSLGNKIFIILIIVFIFIFIGLLYSHLKRREEDKGEE